VIKIVAASMAATLAVLMLGCSADKPVEPVDPVEPAPMVTPPAPGYSAPATDPEKGSPDVAPAQSEAQMPGDAAEPGTLDTPSPAAEQAPDLPPDPGAPPPVRDAKEAAEDAARKIFDATVGAAEKLKEVGMSAVKSVRETVTPPPDSAPDQTLEPAPAPAPTEVEPASDSTGDGSVQSQPVDGQPSKPRL
jgi:hypothetical protein